MYNLGGNFVLLLLLAFEGIVKPLETFYPTVQQHMYYTNYICTYNWKE